MVKRQLTYQKKLSSKAKEKKNIRKNKCISCKYSLRVVTLVFVLEKELRKDGLCVEVKKKRDENLWENVKLELFKSKLENFVNATRLPL